MWIVEIHNDHINTDTGVSLVIEELIGLSTDDARQMAEDIHQHGQGDFTPVAQAEAERLVAAFQVRGLNAKLRKARRA
ncbi:ATP-dependent Clp protease adaptor ClpS [Amycolatopsis sp. cmx-11-51]|uniref:ATP-dependent Clp protease adaptor ClpS n=1 Tax=unclassified Amycolatopsis TaxID=2618356 RepID=UPI0039E540C6